MRGPANALRENHARRRHVARATDARLCKFERLEPRHLLAAATLASTSGLWGEFFNATNLTGLASTRVDPTINFTQNWNAAPMGTSVAPDANYSVRWSGEVNVAASGAWTFFTTSNDGVRLWVDNVPLINNWTQHTVTQNSGTTSLAAGWHSLRLEYFQQGGSAEITLSFQGPGQTKTIIPESQLRSITPQARLSDPMVVGGVSASEAKVFLRTDMPAVDVAIQYSTSPSFSAALQTTSVATAATSDFTAIIPLKNLLPETKYFYREVIGGVPSATSAQSFTTFPVAGALRDFSFVVMADLENAASNPTRPAPAYQAVAASAPAFVMQIGDFDHRNPTTLAAMRSMHRQIRNGPAAEGAAFAQYIAPSFPFFHVWDDHDFGTDDADKTFPGRPAALQAFAEYYPTPDRANSAGVWQSFVYGQAEFFMIDARSQADPRSAPDGPDKSMLDGDNIPNGQLEWLKQGLLNSTATWKFLVSGVPFNPGTKPYDAWGAYPRERQEVLNFINSNAIENVVVISGDLHTGGALDDGTNSGLPEISVPHTNLPVSLPSSGTIGAWSHGFTPGTAGGGFARITVDAAGVHLEARAEDGTLRRQLLVPKATSATTPGLYGEYFNEINLTNPASTRVDSTINFPQHWGSAPPGTRVTPDNNYSTRWTGYVFTPVAGTWTFFTTSNDGVRLSIENSLLINNWTQHAVIQNQAATTLTAGWHPIRLEYFQQAGVAEITLAFQGPGQAKVIIPSTNLRTAHSAAALTSASPGDLDLDGAADGADFLLWQRTAGDAAQLAAWSSNFSASTTAPTTSRAMVNRSANSPAILDAAHADAAAIAAASSDSLNDQWPAHFAPRGQAGRPSDKRLTPRSALRFPLSALRS